MTEVTLPQLLDWFDVPDDPDLIIDQLINPVTRSMVRLVPPVRHDPTLTPEDRAAALLAFVERFNTYCRAAYDFARLNPDQLATVDPKNPWYSATVAVPILRRPTTARGSS